MTGLVTEAVGVGDVALAAVERGQLGDVLGRELEVEDGEVLALSLGVGRLGDRDQPLLHVPAQHDLRRGAAVVLREAHDHRLLQQPTALPQRAVRLGRDALLRVVRPYLGADVARVEALWRDTRAALGAGGPFLFGAEFGAADAMFAPVVARLLTYAPPVRPETRAYLDAVRAHPLVGEWYDDAAREPVEWRQARYEPTA